MHFQISFQQATHIREDALSVQTYEGVMFYAGYVLLGVKNKNDRELTPLFKLFTLNNTDSLASNSVTELTHPAVTQHSFSLT